MKFSRSLLATLLFGVLLLSMHYLHVSLFRVNVVFYAAVADAVMAALGAAILVTSLAYFGVLSAFEKIQLVVIWLLMGYAFAISVPTVIDRSLSFYILEKLQQRGGAIRQDGFVTVFTQEYVKEHRLVDVRLTEQMESGTITIQNGCVHLTEKGRSLATFSRFYRQHFLPKHRLLMGSYSDDLTDPFRREGLMRPDYLCL